jgi:hypothetical protein
VPKSQSPAKWWWIEGGGLQNPQEKSRRHVLELPTSGRRVARLILVYFKEESHFMIDALFWYSGVAAWVLIALACVSMLAAEVNDRARRRSLGHD